MIRPLFAVTVAIFTIGGQAAMSNIPQPIKVLDTIQGSSYLAIQTALGVLRRHDLDLAQYKIVVVSEEDREEHREEDSLVVIFTDTVGQSGLWGNHGVQLRDETEFNADDLNTFTSKLPQRKVLDTIQGSSLLAIQAAMDVFQKHKPDLAEYKITVVREGDTVVAMFADKKTKPGTRGSSGKRPGFEVKLNADDLKVLRSNFTR